MPGGEPLSLPSPAEVEHADWPALKGIAERLGLNPRGRSAVVRMRVLDHVRQRTRAEPWPFGEHLAPLLTRLGHPEAAAARWEASIRLDAPAPWVGYGGARLAAGDLEEALKAFDRAAQMGDPPAYLHRAELLAARGDPLGAVRACDAFLAARPDDLRALALKATFLARGGSVDEAIAAMERATEAHPDAPEAWRGLGVLCLRAGRAKAAAHAFRAAVQLDDADAAAWAGRGVALLLTGRTRDAIGAFRESLEKEPGRADALNGLGVAYLAAGSGKSALVNLERAAKRVESPQVLLNLARAQEAAKHPADARRAYERVLRIDPKRPEAAAAKRRLAAKPRATPRKEKGPARRTTRPGPAKRSSKPRSRGKAKADRRKPTKSHRARTKKGRSKRR